MTSPDIFLPDADHLLCLLAEQPEHPDRDHLTQLAIAHALTSIATSLAPQAETPCPLGSAHGDLTSPTRRAAS